MKILQTHFGDLGAFEASNILHSQETRQNIETTWQRPGLHQALEQINPDAMHGFWIALNCPDTQGNRAQGCYPRSQRQPKTETVMNIEGLEFGPRLKSNKYLLIKRRLAKTSRAVI